MFPVQASSVRNPIRLIPDEYPWQRCTQHAHYLIQFQLPCCHNVCVMCLTHLNKYFHTCDAISHCSYGGLIPMRHINDCILYYGEETNNLRSISITTEHNGCYLRHNSKVQIRLLCGQKYCMKCLREKLSATWSSEYKICEKCTGLIGRPEIHDWMEELNRMQTALVHEWRLINSEEVCEKHRHRKVCLKLSCGRPLCLVCIRSFIHIMDTPFEGNRRTSIKCNYCHLFVERSEILKLLKELPKTITEASIIQKIDEKRQCDRHKDALCVRLPCDVLLCRKCIVELEKEAKGRHDREPINQKQPYAAKCPCGGDTIPGEVLDSFLKEGLPVFRRCTTDYWCNNHKHHKIVMKNERNISLCKRCFEENKCSDILLDEKTYNVKGADKLFGDASQEELFRPLIYDLRCDCRTLQAQAKLPCGRYVCYHCVDLWKQTTCKTNGVQCPKCLDTISEKHLRTFLDKYDESECYLIPTADQERNCRHHKHWKVICESKLLNGGQTISREKLCLRCVSQNKIFPTKTVHHFLQKNDFKMKDFYKAPESARYSSLCTYHRHHKEICQFPCGKKYCLRCIEESLSTEQRHVNIAGLVVECVECRNCADVIPLEFVKSAIEMFTEDGGDVEITFMKYKRCSCGSNEETASFPCGASLCENCFVKASSRSTIHVLGNECITCPGRGCNDVIPIHTLKAFFSKGEKAADKLIEQKHKPNPAPSGTGKPSTADLVVKKSSISQPANEGHEVMDTAFNESVGTKSTVRNSDTGSETPYSENNPTQKKSRMSLEERPHSSTSSRGKDHRKTADITPEQNHELHTASSGTGKQSTEGSSVDKQPQPPTSPSMNGDREMVENGCNAPVGNLSTTTNPDTNFEVQNFPSKAKLKKYIKEKPCLITCSKDENHREAIIEFSECNHRFCKDCINKKIGFECSTVFCGTMMGPRKVCPTNFPLQYVIKYLENRTANITVKFKSQSKEKCSVTTCRNLADAELTECGHCFCLNCMFELSSIEKAEKTTFCGIGFWKPCRTVIQLETLNKQIKNIRENPSFYIKEKPQRRRCSQYSCGKEAVIEFRNCSHCMCEDCVSVKVSSGETMICGGWFYCNNEIPTEFVMDYLHNIGNVENRTPTGYTRDVCDNPNCPAESLLKRDIRQRFSCEHKLCIVCVSAQRTSGDDEIICKVPTCASSKIRQTDSEIAGIPNIGLTCYASCVLQVLAQTPRFKDSLRTYSPDSDKDDVETMLKELLKSVNDVSGREFFVNWNLMQRLMRKIFQIDRSFRQYQENDCHSFIMALFNALMKTEQDHKKQKDVGNSFLDGPDPDDDSGTGKGTENITNDGRPKAEADLGNTTGKSTCPTTLFESRLTSQFEYSSCTDTENVDDQLFYSLLLPAVVEVKSIAEGLDLYFKSEKFPDNMLPCRKCKTQNDRTTTTRTLLVSKAPDMLMIQLARFREVTYFDDHYKELEKTDHQVKFEETLTIKKAYTMDKKELEYELYGVVLHSGNMHGGHYTSCVRNLNSKKWYSCSDSSVREMPEKSLLQQWTFRNAYLLFYSKKK